ncbi:MAG: methyltransferase domain-containing protein [Fibrobacter sp.]|nr:methyltransferase domain-containing protein [Fibrobacter sp.]
MKQEPSTKSGAVKSVVSNQDGIYKDLAEIVQKYASTKYRRPIADHTREAFAQAEKFVDAFYSANSQQAMASPFIAGTLNSAGPVNIAGPRAVILDSGCGTGESTLHLAKKFPDIPVIGIDKSAARLTRGENGGRDELARNFATAERNCPRNAFWIRAELLDFWRLALEKVQAGEWAIPYHALYYPNPWPKQSEATRRFHLHPIFPTLMALGETLELRTNWEIYAQEFKKAAEILATFCPTGTSPAAHLVVKLSSFTPDTPCTAFERKYSAAGQTLWRVICTK